MMDRVREVFNAVSDGVVRERENRKVVETNLGGRISRIEEEIKVVSSKTTSIGEDTFKNKVRRSEVEMEKKILAACCAVKLQDIEFNGVIEDKKVIVRQVISRLRGDVHPEDSNQFERLLKRTRIIVLGRRTESRRERGRNIYTVPILLELGSRQEAERPSEILRRVGYFSSFHWPGEVIPFVNYIRDEIRDSGYCEEAYFVRVRPDFRGGSVELRADVKAREGGRWTPKAVWYCPPLNRDLWEFSEGLYDLKILGGYNRE